MTDFTLKNYYYCKSRDSFILKIKNYTVRHGYGLHDTWDRSWYCNCPAFKFNSNKECKHIIEAKEKFCGWDQFVCDEELINGNCPKCGGPVETEQYAV